MSAARRPPILVGRACACVLAGILAFACDEGSSGDASPATGEGHVGGARGQKSPGYEVRGAVLYGDPARASLLDRAAEVDVRRCMDEIPEFQQIAGGRLAESKATFHMYREKGNRKLASAVEQAAREAGLLLVVEQGGVVARSGAASVEDLTDAVLAVLAEAP